MSRRNVLWGLAAAGLGATFWYATATAAASADVMVQLTSGPITAHSGQQVTHTVEISAADGDTSSETKAQMTFSTTVPLEGVTAKTTEGKCQVVSAVSVTCDINGAAPADVPVQVTITGQIPAATPAGQVVYNVANVVTEGSDPDMANNTSSNAYVLTASGLAADREHAAPKGVTTVHAVSNVDTTWGTPATVLVGIVVAGAIQIAIMAFMRRRTRQPQSARHRHNTKPWGYRPKHATTPWSRLMAKEIVLPKWTMLRQQRVSQHRLIEQRTYRGTVGFPAAAAVLLVTLALTALPAFAESAHKPHLPTASEQAGHATPKPSKTPRVKTKVKPTPTATSTATATAAPTAAPMTTASAEPTTEPTTEPAPAPASSTAAAPAVSEVDSAPAIAPTHDAPAIPDVEPTDPPKTDHAKLVSALNRSLRRAEYLRQMSACTNADLTAARARVAQLEQKPDGAGKAIEDAQGTVAVLEMGMNATDAELKRAEARVDKLSAATTDWTKQVTGREESAHLAKPVEGEPTSPFGNRFDPYYQRWQLHAGLDLGAGTGAPIHAAAAGTVKQAGWNGGYGNYTCVDHGSVKGEELTTCYAHQSEIDVHVGQKITADQTIGKVGSTGASTGPHLHFEVRLDGRAVDPAPWLGGAQ